MAALPSRPKSCSLFIASEVKMSAAVEAKMVKFAYVTGVLMLIAAPAAAQAPAAQSQQIATTDKSDVNRLVCKTEDTLGSRLSAKKVCLTVQQWKDLAQANREHTEEIQAKAGVRSGN
jgi:predicted transglutaminase-like cysteine proteinase